MSRTKKAKEKQIHEVIRSRPNHVFVSYLRENKAIVDRICDELRVRGVKVWLDRYEIAPGSRWRDAIRAAVRNGQFFIACFSKEYASRARTYMNEELVLAIEELRQRPPNRAWFIPVLLSECEVPARNIGGGETLLDIQWVSLYLDWDGGMKHILDLLDPTSLEIQTLENTLLHCSTNVREATVEEMSLLASKIAVPMLIRALSNSDSEVRASAARKLGLSGARASVPALMALLNHDEEADVRLNAALALSCIGDRAAVPAFMKALKDTDKNVRLEAAETLWKLDARAAMPAYVKFLTDEEESVRSIAARTLGASGDRSVVRALAAALKCCQDGVRPLLSSFRRHEPPLEVLIIEALRKLGDRSAVPALKEALETHRWDDWNIAEAAARALRELGEKVRHRL